MIVFVGSVISGTADNRIGIFNHNRTLRFLNSEVSQTVEMEMFFCNDFANWLFGSLVLVISF